MIFGEYINDWAQYCKDKDDRLYNKMYKRKRRVYFMKSRVMSGLLAATMAAGLVAGTGMTVGAEEEITVSVAMLNNPICSKLADLTKEYYEAEGVKIDFAILPENDLREKATLEASTGGTTYDIYFTGPFEASFWIDYGWSENLQPYIDNMTEEQKASFDLEDIFPNIRDSLADKETGDLYALPFFGESSFFMYNKELFEQAGVEMPENPTWEEIYDLAVAVDDEEAGITGMTMRGAPGWGMSGAPFVTMVNAMGGQFYDMDWNATVDTPEQRAAWEMYKNILRDAGQDDIITYTYNECISLMTSGKCGIWYDATSNGPNLEGADSLIKDKVGYVAAPSGWLWSWGMNMNPNSSDEKKQAAFDFMVWACSKDYVNLTLEVDSSGQFTPSGVRASTYELDEYKDLPYAQATLDAMANSDFNHPCKNEVPYVGCQYIAIPEFPEAGDKMTENLAAYVTDDMTLDEAIADTQKVFEQVAEEGGYK